MEFERARGLDVSYYSSGYLFSQLLVQSCDMCIRIAHANRGCMVEMYGYIQGEPIFRWHILSVNFLDLKKVNVVSIQLL